MLLCSKRLNTDLGVPFGYLEALTLRRLHLYDVLDMGARCRSGGVSNNGRRRNSHTSWVDRRGIRCPYQQMQTVLYGGSTRGATAAEMQRTSKMVEISGQMNTRPAYQRSIHCLRHPMKIRYAILACTGLACLEL